MICKFLKAVRRFADDPFGADELCDEYLPGGVLEAMAHERKQQRLAAERKRERARAELVRVDADLKIEVVSQLRRIATALETRSGEVKNGGE